VNKALIKSLIALWKEVLDANFEYKKLSEKAKEEVYQAIYGDNQIN